MNKLLKYWSDNLRLLLKWHWKWRLVNNNGDIFCFKLCVLLLKCGFQVLFTPLLWKQSKVCETKKISWLVVHITITLYFWSNFTFWLTSLSRTMCYIETIFHDPVKLQWMKNLQWKKILACFYFLIFLKLNTLFQSDTHLKWAAKTISLWLVFKWATKD